MCGCYGRIILLKHGFTGTTTYCFQLDLSRFSTPFKGFLLFMLGSNMCNSRIQNTHSQIVQKENIDAINIYLRSIYTWVHCTQDTGMHIRQSKARKDRSCAGETEHVPIGRDDWNETGAGHIHGKQVPVKPTGQTHLRKPRRTVIHNSRRCMMWMWYWHSSVLHRLKEGTSEFCFLFFLLQSKTQICPWAEIELNPN